MVKGDRYDYRGVPLGMRIARDSQVKKVYRWEDMCVRSGLAAGADTLRTEDEANRLVDKVYQKYAPQCPPPLRPKVTFNDRLKIAWAHGDYAIELPMWARNSFYLCHEIAHTLVPWAKHGPYWVRVAMELYEEFTGADGFLLDQLLVKGKVRVMQKHFMDEFMKEGPYGNK